MNLSEKDKNRLKDLMYMYDEACKICDPIEFMSRQRELLYAVCDYLLMPLLELDKADDE